MPKADFFAWGQNRPHELLCLPRGSASPSVGSYVALKNGDWPGPMSPGDYAITLQDTGDADAPFLVQELVSGRLWYYAEAALQRVPDDVVPHHLRHPPRPGEGSYVTLVHNYKQCSDASRGPLSLMRTEDAYGLVLMESGQRFRVRSCHTRKDWWYDHNAVRPIHMKYIPESLRAGARPTWGDYVALTHDHASFGTAADGPLEPGNLGVVVAVSECSDSQGGLLQARYTVRTCHNGRSYSYQEGALHLVVQQLLHAPKIPPSTGKGRWRKLQCQLQLTQAGSGSHVPTGQSLSRGSLQQVHIIDPGRQYWIAAQLSCKDDDLMLANFKPSAWDLYAPSGRPGHYAHLKPVPCSQQQQWQQQQQLLLSGHQEAMQQQQWPQLLSLAYCNGASAAAGAAAAGSCAWYNSQDDVLFCVFEWDAAETPLTHKAGRVTDVTFVVGVCFKDMEGQYTKQHTLHVQTAPHSSSSSSRTSQVARAQQNSIAVAAAADDIRSSSSYAVPAADNGHDCASDVSGSSSVVFEWLDATPTESSSSRRRRHNSSSSSGEDDATRDEHDGTAVHADESGGSSSSSESSAEEEAPDTENAAAVAADTDRGGRGSSGNNDGRDSSGNNGGSSGTGGPAGSSSSNGSGSREDGGYTAPPTPPAGATGLAAAEDAAAESAAAAAAVAACWFPRVRFTGGSQGNSAAAAYAAWLSEVGEYFAESSSSSAGLPSTPLLCEDSSEASRVVLDGRGSNTCSSSTGRQQTRSGSSGGSSSSASAACDCERDENGRDQQQQQQLSNRAEPSSSSSDGGGSDASTAAADTSRDRNTAAAAAAPSRHGMLRSSAAAAVFGGGVNIGEIMRQVERQADSHEPCWQEGNELAAALAAKAMAAAEEFLPGNWCRPRFQGRQQQQDQQQLQDQLQ